MIALNSRCGRMSLLPAAALLALVPMAAFASPQPEVPTAQAFDGDKPLSSVRQATERCAADPGDCRFHIDRRLSMEYHTTVKSLGNAAINCTKDAIQVVRQITLKTGSTDNLGGEITGNITAEGNISASGEVSAGVNGEAGGTFTMPNMQQGPSASVTAKAGATGNGKVTGSLGVKGAFQGAFKLQYSRNWTTEQTESTSYTTTVRPGDALVFGASSAMQRVAGKITVGGGLSVRNVAVDGPSSVNTSTFIADTYTVPGTACERLRPGGKTAVDDTGSRLAGGTDPLTAVPALPPGARLTHRTVLAAERS
ncbi:hypothetical protein ACOZ38_23680 [Sphaerisporangium viridialbum]|uniref:hypothetical protein n=1 Tax=Sphaerisporangium viridialbum TaxID=46189 RepID=UPI003C731CC4